MNGIAYLAIFAILLFTACNKNEPIAPVITNNVFPVERSNSGIIMSIYTAKTNLVFYSLKFNLSLLS